MVKLKNSEIANSAVDAGVVRQVLNQPVPHLCDHQTLAPSRLAEVVVAIQSVVLTAPCASALQTPPTTRGKLDV